jgi:NAD+ kinase
MNRIGVVAKNDDAAMATAKDLSDWLTAKGLSVFMAQSRPIAEASDCGRSEEELNIPADVDLLVVLGGDGTLLYAARTLGRYGVPILGVNMGGLGFMTELSLDESRPALENVLKGDYTAEPRMMLSITVERNGNAVTEHTVLNDAVINRGVLARILELNVTVDNTSLTLYRADGLIISTPTGSTAYNLAAGGPIVHPTHDSIILTPICPFTLTNRPLLLPPTSEITVSVGPGASDVFLSSDGQVNCPLAPGDRIRVRRSESTISLVKNPYKNYFEILRTKLGWG